MRSSPREYLAKIGRKGGLISRRSLSAEEARRMVRVREARRAYREFHSSCFWSCDPNLEIKAGDIQWVAEQLMRHGGLKAWRKAQRLCR